MSEVVKSSGPPTKPDIVSPCVMPSASRSIEQRLLSSEQVATYLGLGSRWAVRRLMVNAELQAVRLAGKLRFDRKDVDRFIATKKSEADPRSRRAAPRPLATPGRSTTLRPDRLAPLGKRGGRTVTER
jgi:excisionase family DNA binding protein